MPTEIDEKDLIRVLLDDVKRLKKIEAAAIKVVAFHGTTYHHEDCATQWNDKPCDCGLIELAELLRPEVLA